MNKDQLQKEILEKVKEGIKPSDLKKTRGKSSQNKNNVKTVKTSQPIPTPPPKSEQSERNNHELLKKVKELEAKITEQDKTIEDLKNKPEYEVSQNKENNQENNKLFTCHSCQQEWNTEFLQLKTPDGKEYCWDCVDKMEQMAKKDQPQPSTFTCEFCHKTKEDKPIYAHVENMPDKRDSREISRLCSYCSYARAKKENFYCPRFSSGRDGWDINVPEFDCHCERKKYF